MANTTISPNMSMPVPVVGVDPGPDWATNIDACLSVIDSHNHSSGQGLQINPSGLNINSDLTIGSNNLISARSVRFTSQGSAISGSSDLGCIYESGVDLYYNDGNGNQVRITQSGAVAGASGTITGLPSGTASASFAGGTFTFLGSTNTPATMAVGPLVIGSATSLSKTVTFAPDPSLSASYNLTLPLALPVSGTAFLSVTSSGVMSSVNSVGSGSVLLASGFIGSGSVLLASGTVGSGSVVLASGVTGSGSAVLNTAPAFVGVPTGTITANTYTPTVSWNGSMTVNSQLWSYHRIGNIVTVNGFFNGTTASSGTTLISISLPIATTSGYAMGGIAIQQASNLGSSQAILLTLGAGLIGGGLGSSSSGVTVDIRLTCTYQVV